MRKPVLKSVGVFVQQSNDKVLRKLRPSVFRCLCLSVESNVYTVSD